MLDYFYVHKKVLNLLDKSKLDQSCIVRGSEGLSFVNSKFEGDIVDIVVCYYVELPISIVGISQFPIVQRVRVRAWSGSYANKGTTSEAEYVYITPTGTVYHRSQACSYLNLSIQQKSMSQIEAMRNYGNEKYSQCKRCTSKAEIGAVFYLTNYGNRYHVTLTCSGLKRGIITIKYTEIGTKGACSKCGMKG